VPQNAGSPGLAAGIAPEPKAGARRREREEARPARASSCLGVRPGEVPVLPASRGASLPLRASPAPRGARADERSG
jgi:hypothetical protein